MAAPHVAGLVALLKANAASPSAVDTASALQTLKATASPLTTLTCKRPSALECGAGLVDASRALGGSATPTPPPAAPDFSLALSSASLPLGPSASARVGITVTRTNGFAAPVSFSFAASVPGVTMGFDPSTTVGSSSTLVLSVTGELIAGSYPVVIRASEPGGIVRTTSLSFEVSASAPTRSLEGAVAVALKLNTDGTLERKGTATVTPSGTTGLATTVGAYHLVNLEPGRYLVVMLKDANGNRVLDAGDYLGWYTADGTSASPVAPPFSSADADLELVNDVDASLIRLGTVSAASLKSALQSVLESPH